MGVGGIQGLPGTLPSLTREEIAVNDIQEGVASQPDSFLEQGRTRGMCLKFLGEVKARAEKFREPLMFFSQIHPKKKKEKHRRTKQWVAGIVKAEPRGPKATQKQLK